MKKTLKICIEFFFVFCLFIINTDIFAQIGSLKFERLTSEIHRVEKGLSQNTIHSIFQDKYGFLWIGTWDGLNRFDGYEVTVYNKTNSILDGQLSNETVLCINEDIFGNLWIGTELGLNYFDRSSNKILNLNKNKFPHLTLSSDTIKKIISDHKNNIWFATHFGLNKFDFQTFTIQKFWLNTVKNEYLRNNNINCLLFESDTLLWIGTNNGLFKFNINNFSVINHYSTKSNIRLSSDTIHSICIDNHGYFWIGTEKGLDRLDKSKKIINSFSKLNGFNDIKINSLLIDSKDRLWIGTNGDGLFHFDRFNNKFKNYAYSTIDNSSLSNNIVHDIIEDYSGNIWVATWKGLNKINFNTSVFNHQLRINDNFNSLINNTVWSFESYENKIFIATDEGVDVWDRKTNQHAHLLPITNQKINFINKNTRTLVIDNNSQLWIGTLDKGLACYNLKSKELKQFQNNSNDSNSLPNNSILCSIRDMDGDVWFGTWGGGLCCLNKNDNNFINYKANKNKQSWIQNNIIWGLYSNEPGKIWVCTDDGLYFYDKNKKQFSEYKFNSVLINNPNINRVFSAFIDSRGWLWVGTMGAGLCVIDLKTKIFKNFTENNGLANNIVYDFIEDEENNIWTTTNNGISKIDLNLKKFINYEPKDGIQSAEFNKGAMFKLNTNEIICGGMNGFNIFNPKEIIQNKQIPKSAITLIQVFKDKVALETGQNYHLDLPYNKNFFSFKFSALEFTNSAKNQYSFYLENFDKKWNTTNANYRIAEYTNVNPGKYNFKLKVSNNDGLWNEKPLIVKITIHPPWWKTIYFRIFLIVFIALLIWFLIYYNIQRIRNKHNINVKMLAIQKQIFELEQLSLRLQINPHFIFNTLNSIQNFILKSDVDRATSYLSKFAQLMRLVLSSTREAEISLKNEITAIKYYLELEKLRFDDRFDFIFEINPILDLEFIAIPPMIMQPFIENAVLHGLLNKGTKGLIKIKIKVKEQNNILVIEIIDDGIGRKKSSEIKLNQGLKHKSRGVSITSQRLDLLQPTKKDYKSVEVIDLFDDVQNPIGTKVIIKIPFKELL